MKRTLTPSTVTAGLVAALFAGPAFAAPAFDDGSDTVYDPAGTNLEGLNGGTGFGAWDGQGSFDSAQSFGAATTADVGGDGLFQIFGIGANANGTGQLIRDFSSPMAVGEMFSFDLQLPQKLDTDTRANGGIGFGDPGTLGGDDLINFTNVNADGTVKLSVSGSTRSDTLVVANDGTGVPSTRVAFSLLTASTWSLSIGDFTTTGVTNAPVDSFRAFYFGDPGRVPNDATTGSLRIDNLSIGQIPEPASVSLLAAGGLLLARRRRA